MNTDTNTEERIRDELRSRTDEVERLDLDERSLFGMMMRVFTGGLRYWAAVGMVMTLAFTALTVWSGYEFFVAADAYTRIFWGVLAVIGFQATQALKLWFWMEMNRQATLREIKRVEIEVARLRER